MWKRFLTCSPYRDGSYATTTVCDLLLGHVPLVDWSIIKRQQTVCICLDSWCITAWSCNLWVFGRPLPTLELLPPHDSYTPWFRLTVYRWRRWRMDHDRRARIVSEIHLKPPLHIYISTGVIFLGSALQPTRAVVEGDEIARITSQIQQSENHLSSRIITLLRNNMNEKSIGIKQARYLFFI